MKTEPTEALKNLIREVFDAYDSDGHDIEAIKPKFGCCCVAFLTLHTTDRCMSRACSELSNYNGFNWHGLYTML